MRTVVNFRVDREPKNKQKSPNKIFGSGAYFFNYEEYKMYVSVCMYGVRVPRRPGSSLTEELGEVEAISPSASSRV